MFQTSVLPIRGAEGGIRGVDAEHRSGVQAARAEPSRRCHLCLQEHRDRRLVHRLLHYGLISFQYFNQSIKPNSVKFWFT